MRISFLAATKQFNFTHSLSHLLSHTSLNGMRIEINIWKRQNKRPI